jgi:hypothetical protein
MTEDEWREDMARMDKAFDREAAFDLKVEAARALANELDCDLIDAKPQDYDWREEMGEDMEGWRAVLPDSARFHDESPITDDMSVYRCFNCQRQYEEYDLNATPDWDDYEGPCLGQPQASYEDWDEVEGLCPECDGVCKESDDHTTEDQYEPMMNYRYPLGHRSFDNEDANEIEHLPLCVVECNDGFYLALTGGGMDLSPHICRAYIALGYMPPTHFVSLPEYAGYEKDEQWIELIACAQRAAEVQQQWAASRLRHLDTMLDRMRRAAAEEEDDATS